MKTFVCILLALFTANIVSCQNNKNNIDIPEVVLKAFKAKYPDENNPDWEIDANKNYEAQFKEKGEKYRADFSPNGTWIETENSIKKKELPKAVQKAIKKNYSMYKIAEIEHVDHAIKGIFYDVEFKQKGKNKDVEFYENGEELR